MGEVSIIGRMAENMQDSMLMIKNRVMEYTSGLMEDVII